MAQTLEKHQRVKMDGGENGRAHSTVYIKIVRFLLDVFLFLNLNLIIYKSNRLFDKFS